MSSTNNTFFWVRDHLPLKQGLRFGIAPHFGIATYCQGHLPLKQGLRRRLKRYIKFAIHSQRPSSIQTRIKTIPLSPYQFHKVSVRDHLPFKQGLRLSIRSSRMSSSSLTVRDHLPFKQGLRHDHSQSNQHQQIGQRPSSIQTRIKIYIARSLTVCL